MTNRTPTPEIDAIWHRHNTTNLWHKLWIEHLKQQAHTNPHHPANRNNRNDIRRYSEAAIEYAQQIDNTVPHHLTPWDLETDRYETHTRHDLQAALQNLNHHAGCDTAHLGLTSHDITDPTTQIQIQQSLDHTISQTRTIIQALRRQVADYTTAPLLARTHGQPAQHTTYGHRIATILGPLLDWYYRARAVRSDYPLRPPHGAVGTAADLQRVLTGWEPDESTPTPTLLVTLRDDLAGVFERHGWPAGDIERLLERMVGEPTAPDRDPVRSYIQRLNQAIHFPTIMGVTRQVYHRSYDLPVASLMVELASIAQTWATDRRLEAMLGLGNETRADGQVGSSAMAHKTNPVLCERICSLGALARGYYTAMADLAGQSWLEGDVSTSGARRTVLPSMFTNASAILYNWADAIDRWEINAMAIAEELERHETAAATGAVLQWLVEWGVDRPHAHEAIRKITATDPRKFASSLASHFGMDTEQRDQIFSLIVNLETQPIGNVDQQIARVLERAAGI